MGLDDFDFDDVDDFADFAGGRDFVAGSDFVDATGPGGRDEEVEVESSGRNIIFSSFSRVIHGVRRLRGFLVCVISIVPGGAEARMRPIVSFYSKVRMEWGGRER